MPEGVGYASSNVVAGAGLELNYVGDHVFAYSGVVDVGAVQSQEYNLLNFTTGNRTIRALFQPVSFEPTNVVYDFQWKVYLNSVLVYAFIVETGNDPTPYEEIDLIVPPLTGVLITAQNPQAGAGYDLGAVFTGKLV